MATNLDKYKDDLKKLIELGNQLDISFKYELNPSDIRKQAVEQLKNEIKAKQFLSKLPSFVGTYQAWYSEAYAIIKLLLPDRLDDFRRYYERPKTRKQVDYETYVIEDCLQGLRLTRSFSGEEIVGPSAAVRKFEQQINILRAIDRRFESSLFDVKQLVQADLFDSELEAAQELLKKKFNRAAGALTGVVLEKHLRQVCDNHSLSTTKKHPTISVYSEMLKEAGVIDIPQWRGISYLADIRNLCDHPNREPTEDEVSDLIFQVGKLLKTLY